MSERPSGFDLTTHSGLPTTRVRTLKERSCRTARAATDRAAQSIAVRPGPTCRPGATSPGSSTDAYSINGFGDDSRARIRRDGFAAGSAQKKPANGADVGGHNGYAAESSLDQYAGHSLGSTREQQNVHCVVGIHDRIEHPGEHRSVTQALRSEALVFPAVRTIADDQRDCVVQFVNRLECQPQSLLVGERADAPDDQSVGGEPESGSRLRSPNGSCRGEFVTRSCVGNGVHSARRESVQVVQPSCGLGPQGNHLAARAGASIPSANGAVAPGAMPLAHRCSGTRMACRCPTARSHMPEASSTRRRRRRRHRQLELGALAGSTAPAVARRGPERRSSHATHCAPAQPHLHRPTVRSARSPTAIPRVRRPAGSSTRRR